MRRVFAMSVLHVIGVLVLGAVLVFVLYGRENTFKLLFGDPDLGRVEFATLVRPASPNSALICPTDVCASAAIDREPPLFAVPAAELYRRIRAIALAEPLTVQVADHPDALEARFVQRTPLMRFPDTVRLRVIPRGDDRSTIALYSQSQIGYGDMGVNKARIERWLAKLEAEAPKSP